MHLGSYKVATATTTAPYTPYYILEVDQDDAGLLSHSCQGICNPDTVSWENDFLAKRTDSCHFIQALEAMARVFIVPVPKCHWS